MIEQDEAAGYLARLATPTMEAFTEAARQYAAHRKAMAALRGRMAKPVTAVIDGINYWGPFATFLDERYERVAGVARVRGTHPLAHRWTVDDTIVVQLKSDTGNLPLEQLMLPNMPKARNGSMGTGDSHVGPRPGRPVRTHLRSIGRSERDLEVACCVLDRVCRAADSSGNAEEHRFLKTVVGSQRIRNDQTP